MSDDLKKFLKRHDVKIEAPKGEWYRIKSRISEPQRGWFLPRPLVFGLASLGVAVLVFVSVSNRQTSMNIPTPAVVDTLSDEEAADFLDESFADFVDDSEWEEDDFLDM